MRWAPLAAILGVLGCSAGGARPGADGGKPPAEADPPGSPAGCGPPQPPMSGIVIDDLRVE